MCEKAELQADVIGRLVEAAFKYQIEAKKPVRYADRLALEYRTILVGVDRLPRRRQQRSGTDEKPGMVVANRHKPLIAQTFGHGGRPTLQLVARSFDFGQGIAEGNFLKQSPGDDAAQPVTVGRTVKRFGQKTADEHLSLEQIGRAHVCTPVTNAHYVCRLLLEKKTQKPNTSTTIRNSIK